MLTTFHQLVFILLKHVNPFGARKGLSLISFSSVSVQSFDSDQKKKNTLKKWNIFICFLFSSSSSFAPYLGSYLAYIKAFICIFTVHWNGILVIPTWYWAHSAYTHHFQDIWRLFLTDGRRQDQTKSFTKLQSHFCLCWEDRRAETSNELVFQFILYCIYCVDKYSTAQHSTAQYTFYWLIVMLMYPVS